jgi:hypothetical protein
LNGKKKAGRRHDPNDVSERSDAAEPRPKRQRNAKGHANRKAAARTSNAAQSGAAALAPVKTLSQADIAARKESNLRRIDSWFAQRSDEALAYLDDIMAQQNDMRLGFDVAKEILAHNGSISPLAKIPATAVVQNLNIDPRTIETMSRHLASMSEGEAAMRGSLRPIDQIGESRYASLSEAVLAEPTRQPEEIIVGPATPAED